jgi:hypothetical protein
MIHDPDRVEDVLKVDATEGDPLSGDDAYDETRYALMSRPAITDAIVPKIAIGSPAWHKKINENLFEQEIDRYQSESNQGWPTLE